MQDAPRSAGNEGLAVFGASRKKPGRSAVAREWQGPLQGAQHGQRLRSQGFIRFAKAAMQLRLPCNVGSGALPKSVMSFPQWRLPQGTLVTSRFRQATCLRQSER